MALSVLDSTRHCNQDKSSLTYAQILQVTDDKQSRARSFLTGRIIELMEELLPQQSTPVLLKGTVQFIKAK